MGPVASDTTNLWVEAIQTLDDDDKALIWGHATDKASVLDDVLTSAKRKEKECEAKRWAYTKRDGTKVQLSTLFKSVVEKGTWLKKLGDSFAALDPAHLRIPWAAVGLALQIAEKYFENDALAHEGIEMMNVLVPRYTVFECLYLQTESQIKKVLADELVKLYSSALRFTVKLKRYYEQGTAKRIARTLMLTFHQVEELMKEVKDQQILVDDLGRLVDAERARNAANTVQDGIEGLRKALEDFHNPIQSVEDKLADLSLNVKVQKEREILKWLSPVSYDRSHQSLRLGRLEGTGLWLFNHQEYKDWRTSKESSILWLHGQPGTGKSTLMSLIIDSLRGSQVTQAGPLAFVYCSRNIANDNYDGPEAITRNIIKQLSRLQPGKPLREAVVRKHDDLQEDGYGGEMIAYPDTRDLLLQLLDQDTMVFIDAVDECTPDQNTELFQLINTLMKPDSKRIVRILISSRPSLDISARLRVFGKLFMVDAAENKNDIRLFARSKATECVQSMKLRDINVSDELQDQLEEELITGAQGMFLWVKLQADLLNDPKQTSFQEDVLLCVRQAPRGLSSLYSVIYQKIEAAGKTMRETAVAMFKWLLCAKASIGSDELRAALAKYIDVKHLTEAVILDSCSNLVMIDDGLDTFRFIHTSVKDFVKDKIGFSLFDAHATLAEICLGEVNQDFTMPQQVSLRQGSLQCYVILYWISHVEQAGRQHLTPPIERALSDLCLDGKIRPWVKQWLEQVKSVCDILEWNDPFKNKVLQILSSPETSFFAACAFGFAEVVSRYCEPRPDLFRAQNEMGATGLHLACEYGHLAVAKELLQGGADVDRKDKYGETPLVRACSSGHEDIIMLLLGKKANAKIQGRRFGTALQAAALHGHLSVIQRLIKHGVDLEAEGGQFGTALQAASVRGHVHVVRELLASGASINAPGGDYEAVQDTAPSKSVADGIRKAVEFILESKEDDDSKLWISPPTAGECRIQLTLDRTLDMNLGKTGFGPALHAAARSGHEDVLNILLSAREVDVNLEGGLYGSALQAAAVSGSVSIVAMLLKAGADINLQNGTYGTALIAACRRSHFGLTKFLLKNRAIVNVQAGVYGTALQVAARSGSYDLVRLLLENGADPNLVAGMYGTPLQTAARDGFDEILTLLIENGADISIEGGSFKTPLQAASTGGHLSSVQLLIDKGASFGNAVQVACLGGYTNVVQFLLSNGGDIGSRSDKFGTAMQAAAAGRNIALVRVLLEKYQAVNPSEDLGAALELAAAAGDKDLAKDMLDLGANPAWFGRSPLVSIEKDLHCDTQKREFRESCPLERAAESGREDVVRMFLEHMKSLSTSSCGQAVNTALRAAAKCGHVNIISMLADHGVDSPAMHSALCLAVAAEHLSTIRLLVDLGAGITSHTIDLACTQGNSEIIELLLQEQEKSGIKQVNASQLLQASLHGHLDVVRSLIDHGADINGLAVDNRFDEHESIDDNDKVGQSIQDSLDFNVGDSSDNNLVEITSLHDASHSAETFFWVTSLHGAILGGHEDVFDLLLEQHASITVRGEGMPTVLQLASSIPNPKMVEKLLDLHANVNLVSGRYGTALQAAAKSGSQEVVQMLLQHGANVNQEAGQFGTALQAAAAHGHEAIVRQLLTAGASTDIKTEGGSPFPAPQGSWAMRQLDAMKMLLGKRSSRRQRGMFGTSLLAAAESGNVEIVRILLDLGADVQDTDKLGRTPLHRAVGHGHEAVVAFLLQRGARIDKVALSLLSGFSSSGVGVHSTPLLLAAANGHVTILEQLINRGYDIGIKTEDGETALIVAVQNGWSSAARLLIDKRSDINHRDKLGNTPLHWAVVQSRDGIVRLLLARGANSNARNKRGETPLHIAISKFSENPTLLDSDEFRVLYILIHHPGIQLEATDHKGATALHHIVKIRNRDMAITLLDKGANINAGDSMGRTPLHYCVLSLLYFLPSPVPMLQLLISRGADINAKTNDDKNVVAIISRILPHKEETLQYLAGVGVVGASDNA